MLLSFYTTKKKTSEVRERVKYFEKIDSFCLNKNLKEIPETQRQVTQHACLLRLLGNGD
jgi:hypothetical protein